MEKKEKVAIELEGNFKGDLVIYGRIPFGRFHTIAMISDPRYALKVIWNSLKKPFTPKKKVLARTINS